MLADCLKEGAGMVRKRFGLVLLLYGVNLLVAALVAWPIYQVYIELVGTSGYDADLVKELDFVLWWEMFFGGVQTQLNSMLSILLWVIPIYWVWKTASQMGIIYALHNGAIWPFWRGVGYYTIQGLQVALFFLPLKVLWILLIVILTTFLHSSIWPGVVGGFWLFGVLTPLFGLTGWAVLDLYQRSSRLALVIRHDAVWQAIKTGLSWPSRNRTATLIYLVWYAMALFTLLVTVSLNAMLHVGAQVVLIGFVIQQVSILTRSVVTVGWSGSEVSLFENTWYKTMPFVADTVGDFSAPSRDEASKERH